MNNLADLWKRRFSQFLKEVGHYSRLIFNDHFSIILLFMLGFGAFYYREQLIRLEAMDPQTIRWQIIVLVLGIQGLAFYVGRPMWLTQDSDKSYLFARGKEWQSYWLRGTLVSLVLPLIILALATLLTVPLLTLVTSWTNEQTVLLVILVCLFKIFAHLFLYLNAFRLPREQTTIWHHLMVFLVSMGLSYYLANPWHLLVLVLILVGEAFDLFKAFRKRSNHPIQFNEVLDAEALRESRFYKWISVFADVPHLKPSFKRRSYLDGFIEWFSKKFNDRYSFLFIRSLMRNNTYSGIWIRVMLFITALLLFVNNFWFAAILGGLGFLLTVVQLVPLLNYYVANPFQRIYPNRQTQILRPFQQVIAAILLIEWLVYSIVVLIVLPVNVDLLLVIGIWLALVLLFTVLYIPFWYRKHKKTY